jgi:hypothetical protein
MVCTLIHNPMGPNVAPEAAEQWHNNLNHLIITAINMPNHRRHWAHHSGGSPVLSHTLTVVRTPMAVCLTTTNLRAKLEHHRLGEDGCTTIEHQCERRRNLDDHYDTMNAAPSGHATHTPTSPRRGVDAWRLPRTSEWWFGHASSGLTCWKSMMGPSTPPRSDKSTPPPTSMQEGMRSSWLTIFLWP